MSLTNSLQMPKHRNIFAAYRKRKTPLVIGICGRSTSGKSTISKWLQRDFPNDVIWISTDLFFNIFKPKKADKDCWSECPSTVDWAKLIATVKKLKKNKPTLVPSRNWITVTDKLVEPKPIIIVEGYLIFTHKKLMNLLDKKIFIEVSDFHMLYRRLLRNNQLGNLKYIMERVIPVSKRFEDKQKLLADVVLDGNNETEHLYETVLHTLKPKKHRRN
ncbi:MAG: hypothetical protein WCW13_04100 [archaeon]